MKPRGLSDMQRAESLGRKKGFDKKSLLAESRVILENCPRKWKGLAICQLAQLGPLLVI